MYNCITYSFTRKPRIESLPPNQKNDDLHLRISQKRKTIEKPSATIYKIVACLTGSCGSRGNGKTNAFSTIEIMEDSPVDVDVKHWFSMQNIGIEDPNTSSQLTSEEQLAESLLEKCTYYDAIKRYEHTKLLWIDLLT